MRNLILFMHTSLDGFVAGPNGEMDWINVDDEMFEYAGKQQMKQTRLYMAELLPGKVKQAAVRESL
jgi:hypothetical protein